MRQWSKKTKGKRQTRKPKRGTPQGGVISPLLAKIYLNLFDRTYRWYGRSTGLAAELVRYADDFVILMRRGADPGEGSRDDAEPGLRLNEAKTKVIDARQGRFDFWDLVLPGN